MASHKFECVEFDAAPTKHVGRASMSHVTIGGQMISRVTVAPGWRWSVDIKPTAKTENCTVHHVGIIIAGEMGVEFKSGPDAGKTVIIKTGHAFDIPPDHDAWVVGDSACVMIDFTGLMKHYGEPPQGK